MKTKQEHIEILIARMKHRNPVVRAKAALALGDTKLRRAAKPLIDALADDSIEVVKAAIKSLWWIHDPRTLNPLLTIIKETKDPKMKVMAVEGILLGCLKSAPARPVVDALIECLHHDDTVDSAFDLFPRFSHPYAIKKLTQTLRSECEIARFGAARAIADMACDDLEHRIDCSIPAIERGLIRLLKDTNDFVREGAAMALAALNLSSYAVKPLIRALSDDYVGVRDWAATALENKPDRRAIRPLLKLAAGSFNNGYSLDQESAGYALAAISDPSIVRLLCDELRSADEWGRQGIAHALSLLSDAKATDAIIAMSDDSSPSVREYVTGLLAQLFTPEAKDALLRMLHDPSSKVRSAALQELLGKGEPLIDDLIAIVVKKKGNVRSSFAKVLISKSPDQALRKHIQQRLRSEGIIVRVKK